MLRRRLLNLARIETNHAAARLRAAAVGLWELGRSRRDTGWESQYERMRQEVEQELKTAGSGPTPLGGETSEIRRYYANLELPLGSPADEVKAAYRRLMRRYHPDKHAGDPESIRAAHQLARELRLAYEGLLQYLSEK
ncbi:MAG: J domain-containing protein [Myxococcales bacterium]|nr:J domain-containing protein [Myxococcales bacterium]